MLLFQTIKDSQLMVIISMLGAVVLIVLVLWESIAPNEKLTRVLTDQVGVETFEYTNETFDYIERYHTQ